MDKSNYQSICITVICLIFSLSFNFNCLSKTIDQTNISSNNDFIIPSKFSNPSDPRKLIVTFTVSQWYCMPEAMQKIAEVAHSEDVPVSWILSYSTALEEKKILDEFHEKYGDEIIAIRGNESMDDWKESFPWASLNIVLGARPENLNLNEMKENNIDGLWGYCDQQIGIDGITHYGSPWGLFYVSEEVPFIPPSGKSQIVGIPWTLRDIHKCFHLKQAINFTTDPVEHVRSKTLCTGEDITFFQDMIDELMNNLPWNDRIYCCLHEEANGPYIKPGEEFSDEGASLEDSKAMYSMIKKWLRYLKKQGATITTLSQAVRDYKKVAKEKTLPSTILTTDKHKGSIIWYADPVPRGVRHTNFGPSGNFPDTLFHYDNECQLVFVHPEILPRQTMNYKAQYTLKGRKPYPVELAIPSLVDWKHQRNGDVRTYTFTVQSFYSMPFGLTEWGNFDGWEVVETNGMWAKIIDDRVMLVRFNLNVEELEHNKRWKDIWVKLKKK